ncbi:hypothetical protein Y017_12880 [Alcanivorax sp. 97CO-5]|uniref:translocation/assembly module TamB domain-containing protein n=1 Tax=unclassified Alcanivorax TaxID=2638842 RepID=UPI0003E7F6F3|nr:MULTISPECIES: translocation/assembly module TamB domain-containing protein [unclassified Alcanivorax]EUC69804.1 hypothetical protein Y017_12880 [Alcanivorax sp. 97CO-5]PKG01643.1 DUF490 domain-containing protein [Alcanivorax sp. 97CO-6]BAP13615.1 hypothetical protein AS19_07640 [Alcanivorax sp. NBRC 101098]
MISRQRLYGFAMGQILTRGLLVLLSLLLVCLLALALLLGTATGNRWILEQATPFIPGELTVGEWHGSLLSGITLNHIDYRYQELNIRLDQLSAELAPHALLKGWLELTSLSLGTLHVTLPPADDTPPQPDSLPDSLLLPFGIRIDALTVGTFQLNDTVLIRQLEADNLAAWRRFQIARLQTLTLAGANVQATAQGKLTAPFDVQGTASWALPLPESDTLQASHANGQLTLTGPLSQLQIHHQLSGPVKLQSQGQWLLKDGQWQIALQHHWPAQALPLTLPQPLALGKGELGTHGPLDALQLKGHTGLASGERKVAITLDSALIPGGITLHDLTVKDGEQTLGSRGQVLFSPLSWDLDLSGDLDTALLHPLLPGQLAIDGHSKGQWDGDRWSLSPSELSLRGDVRQQPLSVTSTVQSQTANGKQQLQLRSQGRWGDNWLQANGQVWPQWQLRSKLNLTRLEQLYPGLAGSVAGQIQLNGRYNDPALSGQLTVNNLSWQDWSLGQMQSRFSQLRLPQTSQPGSMSLTLNGHQLTQANTEHVGTFALSADGTWAEHQLTASARRDTVELNTRLQGGMNTAGNTWQGTLADTRLQHLQLGIWQQDTDSTLRLSAQSQSLSPFCLVQAPSRLCLQGNHAANTLEAQARLADLPLALINTLLGPTLSMEGTVDANLSVQGPLDNPKGQFALQSREANITINTADAPPPLEIKQLSLHGNLANQRVNSALTLTTALGNAHAQLEHGLGLDATLQGDVNFDLSSLAFVELFTADLREVKGSINGDFSLAGSLRQPIMNGAITLQNGQTLIPFLGVDIADVQVAIQGNPQGQLDIIGSAQMGSNTVALNGAVDPSQPNIPMQLTLSGDRLLAADRPDARILLTPDLTLTGSLEGLTLSGSLTIPEAEISPVEIPEGAITVSKDQVLVHQQADSTTPLPLAMDVTLTLGDKVHFNGFGLDAMLGGALQVEQKPQRPPQLNGELIILEGRYRAYGQNLAISDGQLIFQGPPENPGLDIRAIRKIPSEGVVAGVQLSGTLQEPNASLFSDPSMEQSQAMSYLLTGRPLESGSKSEGNKIAQALALYGLERGSGVTEKIGDKLGVDEISVGSDWESDDAALMLGKQLSERLYLTYAVGLFDAISTVILRYTLTRSLHLEARSSSEANSIDVIWEKELR